MALITAPSVNGFTSATASVWQDGIHHSFGCQPPVAVVADMDIIAEAPIQLIRAGFADLCGQPFSLADWLLAHRMDASPHVAEAADMAQRSFSLAFERSQQIGRREPAALEPLVEGLLLSGMAMAVATTSAPCSGAEHLISQFWDLWGINVRGGLYGFHGLQVGIGTILSARLYSRLLSQDISMLDPEVAMMGDPADRASFDIVVKDAYRGLPDNVIEAIVEQAAPKFLDEKARRDRILDIQRVWPDLRPELERIVLSANTIRNALGTAGAPVEAADLGIPDGEVLAAVRLGRYLRPRYSVLDQLDTLGLLHGLAERALRGSARY